MATAKPKRAPAWSRAEVFDSSPHSPMRSVLAQLRSSKRNLDIYGMISQDMLEKGPKRDAQQCRVKIKELQQTYQKAREGNSRSGSSPKTCRFYDEVHAILRGDPTTVTPRTIDTSASSQSMINDEDSVDEEEGALDSRMQESGVSVLQQSQELFLTPEQSTSTQDSINDPVEGTSDTSAADRPLSAADRLSQLRKRKKKSRDDMLANLMNASAAAQTEQRERWLTLSCICPITRHNKCHVMGQMQDGDRSATQETLQLMRAQADILWHLMARVLLQPLNNAPQLMAMPPSPSPSPNRSQRLYRKHYMLTSTSVEVSRKLLRPCCVPASKLPPYPWRQ
ncbi:uncharacterized protein [Emydura macquarii macquarii]|uniref:uncharacterized protein n=1 Tax=Emydura macquarii macquarii TaxID=1129001 RepID=UPI00352A8DCF